MKFNQKTILDEFRKFYRKNFNLAFTKEHEKNLLFLITKLESDSRLNLTSQVAYILATVIWETGKTIAPVREIKAKPGTKLFHIQNRYWNTNFMGRGFCQITWHHNYFKFSKLLDIDLVSNPDLALKPEIAYEILVIGMTKGIFTGKKLSNYITSEKADYISARKIINGTDKAELIAGYAKEIEQILRLGFELPKEDTISVNRQEAIKNLIPASPKQQIPATHPQAPAVVIDAIKTVDPKGLNTAKSVLTSIGSAVAVSASSFIGWLKSIDPTSSKIFLIIGGIILVLGFISGIIYLIMRNKLVRQREAHSHELTLKTMELRADPQKFNIEIKKDD